MFSSQRIKYYPSVTLQARQASKQQPWQYGVIVDIGYEDRRVSGGVSQFVCSSAPRVGALCLRLFVLFLLGFHFHCLSLVGFIHQATWLSLSSAGWGFTITCMLLCILENVTFRVVLSVNRTQSSYVLRGIEFAAQQIMYSMYLCWVLYRECYF